MTSPQAGRERDRKPGPSPIYLDHHSTTPLDPRVLDAMLPYLREDFGNAASTSHIFGWRAEAAVEEARERIAEAITARPARTESISRVRPGP